MSSCSEWADRASGRRCWRRRLARRAAFPRFTSSTAPTRRKSARCTAKVDLKKTLCIVSSKSGSTLEPNIFKAYFWDEMKKAVGDKTGQHFVAVTDPGSKMQKIAERDGFREVFFGDKTLGGRYSVLSNFGMVPAAAMGLDLEAFLDATALMVRSCAAGTPPAANPGVRLGLIMGEAAKAGRDKLTIFASPGLADVGAWARAARRREHRQAQHGHRSGGRRADRQAGGLRQRPAVRLSQARRGERARRPGGGAGGGRASGRAPRR